MEYQAGLGQTDGPEQPMRTASDQIRRNKLIAFAAVSIGCTAAAVATGSYALWLSKRRIADEALTSVHDLLETCRSRVSRMEADLNQLASHAST